MLVRVQAKNDVNGNPRRGWIQFSDDGNFIQFIDEGYLGFGAISELVEKGEADTIAITIEPSEYKRFKKSREAVK
jgi:hypothetical protein